MPEEIENRELLCNNRPPTIDIFDVIGGYGPWQRNAFILFFIANIIGMWHNFAITFMAPNMEFWCIAPNVTDAVIADVSEGIKGTDWNSKTVNDLSPELVQVASKQCEISISRNRSVMLNGTGSGDFQILKCTDWEYNLTLYSSTIVSEWDLVCDREWLVSLSKSIYMIGFMISVLLFGQLSDIIGRWPTIMICFVITCVSGIVSAFSTSYVMFIVLRFFLALGRTGMTTTGFVLFMEIIGPKHRTQMGIAIQMGWAVGFIIFPGVAWFVRDWSSLQLTITVPFVALFIAYWVVPESPRWLMTKRKFKKFKDTVDKAAKKNKKETPLDYEKIIPDLKNEIAGDRKGTLFDLFRTPQLRKKTINLYYIWIVNAFVYYSLSYNTNDLGGDPYLNFFIAGVLELPAYLITLVAIKKVGRRIPLMVSMVVAGIACAAIIPIPENLPWLITTFAMIGKSCITGSFGILYIYSSELFPTVVRNVGIGSSSTCARIGSIVAPFVRELGKATHPAVPNAVYAGLAISSGLLALLLPETSKRKIPDTLEEGENFGRISEENSNNPATWESETLRNISPVENGALIAPTPEKSLTC